MTFAESVKTCLTKYVDFSGVASRSEFWWFMLFVVVAGIVLGWISPWLANIFGLAMVLPELAAGARRLHDTGRSGWWQLLVLLPVIGIIVLIVFWVQPPKR
jgi:uncharacterized membrane protein YhaH (DUF805 family)